MKRFTEESKRFFTAGILFWGPTLILGIVLLVRLNQSLTWIPGTCFVRNVTEPVCVGSNQTQCNARNTYTSSWMVDFCATTGCPMGPLMIKISFNESGLQATRQLLGLHPVNSTDTCYLDPLERAIAVWSDQVNGIFSWAFPLFIFFLMFTLTLISPCVYRGIVSVRLYIHYKKHGVPSSPPRQRDAIQPLPSRMVVNFPLGHDGRIRASISSSDGLVIPDVRKLDLEASVADDQSNDEEVCKVCYAHRINCRLEPCGHSFTCLECGRYFVGRTCGLCRAEITAAKRIRKTKRRIEKAREENESSGDVALPDPSTKKKKKPQKRRKKVAAVEETPQTKEDE